jgi:hypothetical protein
MDDCEDHVHITIPVTVDFYLLGREDAYRCEVGVPTAIGLDYEAGDFEVDELREMISGFIDEMFESRSLQRAHFDGVDGYTYVIKLAEVQACTIHPVSINAVDRIAEEALSE